MHLLLVDAHKEGEGGRVNGEKPEEEKDLFVLDELIDILKEFGVPDSELPNSEAGGPELQLLLSSLPSLGLGEQ